MELQEREFLILIKHLEEERNGDQLASGPIRQVAANAAGIKVAVERFLPFGAVTMIGADPGTGKSVLIYRLAEAAAYGKQFAGQLQTVQGNVLIVQKDESDSNLKQKVTLMDLQDPEDRIHVRFEFSGGHFPELRKWITEHNAKYVLMDSFGSLFAGGADLSDAEAGLYLYQLNAIASQMDVAILLTHHLRKMDRSRNGQRNAVHLGDFYGSAYVSAGTSDAWGLYRDPDQQNQQEEPRYILAAVKARSGLAQLGDKFRLQGGVEDLSLQVEEMNGVLDGVTELRDNQARLLQLLRKRSEANPIVVSHPNPNEEMDMVHSLGLCKSTVSRLLSGLIADGTYGIRHKSLPELVRKGRSPRGYWAIR